MKRLLVLGALVRLATALSYLGDLDRHLSHSARGLVELQSEPMIFGRAAAGLGDESPATPQDGKTHDQCTPDKTAKINAGISGCRERASAGYWDAKNTSSIIFPYFFKNGTEEAREKARQWVQDHMSQIYNECNKTASGEGTTIMGCSSSCEPNVLALTSWSGNNDPTPRISYCDIFFKLDGNGTDGGAGQGTDGGAGNHTKDCGRQDMSQVVVHEVSHAVGKTEDFGSYGLSAVKSFTADKNLEHADTMALYAGAAFLKCTIEELDQAANSAQGTPKQTGGKPVNKPKKGPDDFKPPKNSPPDLASAAAAPTSSGLDVASQTFSPKGPTNTTGLVGSATRAGLGGAERTDKAKAKAKESQKGLPNDNPSENENEDASTTGKKPAGRSAQGPRPTPAPTQDGTKRQNDKESSKKVKGRQSSSSKTAVATKPTNSPSNAPEAKPKKVKGRPKSSSKTTVASPTNRPSAGQKSSKEVQVRPKPPSNTPKTKPQDSEASQKLQQPPGPSSEKIEKTKKKDRVSPNEVQGLPSSSSVGKPTSRDGRVEGDVSNEISGSS
ncbi:Metallopeptidase, catalytic domain protein [Ophiocordyceps sinensis CO18]|uniref:deuterolysin n=1 Tax=Ophiocordyceps sinensis (strain Co18 / CGMCC 3.14243) TaxID=911162 RepID=T5A9M5_OPHSC|nr:Metallopeptidase, catalytic domain protein [Ophiocordyceps sinensis CO18]